MPHGSPSLRRGAPWVSLLSGQGNGHGTPVPDLRLQRQQVRDNIHANDVCRFFEAFYEQPRVAAVYNLGGGRGNSVSMLEAIAGFELRLDRKLNVEYLDQNRIGDHICYISDLRRIEADYPSWRQEYTLDRTLDEIAASVRSGAAG